MVIKQQIKKSFEVKTLEIIEQSLNDDKVFDYEVSCKEFKVVDIPPGFTHSIKNIGKKYA